jgi:rhamnose transport system permease protein
MAEATIPAAVPTGSSSAARLLRAVARQRELSLVVVMVVLGAYVFTQAPQLLSASNLTQVTAHASIIAVAAVGEAIVILTRNVDLSIEATIGLVAFAVADILASHTVGAPVAILLGVLLGLVLGLLNGVLVAVLRVPAIIATLGTLSAYRGFTLLLAGGKQITLTQLPPGYTDWARGTVIFLPLFVVIALVVVTVAALVLRQTTIGRQVYALGSNPEAAEILGIRTRLITISTFAVCGLLAGVAGVMWGLEFGTINATAATGVTLQVIAAVVVGGVNINGGSGTVVGAGIGALFLAFIQNALILLKLSQFWLQAIYGLVILIAVVLDGALLRAVQRSRARGRRP